jgi:tetratricopeptide (TPR) repeat protein
MNTNELIEAGNQHRANNHPEQALQCYAMAFVQDPESSAAFNNYGNVMRECGFPQRAIPFLQHATVLEPNNVTANFNLAVCYLLMGDYQRGWPAYETRWSYEHLAGTEPKYSQPRWRGEDLTGKTILVIGEQGHGDCIQFVRFVYNLHVMGAKVKLQVTDGLIPLLESSPIIEKVAGYGTDMGEFDYWVPIMSIPGILGVTLENLPPVQNYLNADAKLIQDWLTKLGPKYKMRIGFSWSGRRDSWLNQHKGVPFPVMLELIKSNPQYEWINLQIDATEDEELALADAGVTRYPGAIQSFAETAALIMHMDVVISVDTAITHLAGSLGRPVWVMLNAFATDWRWLLDRDSSPWYSSARLFRQPQMGDWASVIKKIAQYLSWYKV